MPELPRRKTQILKSYQEVSNNIKRSKLEEYSTKLLAHISETISR